MSNIAIKVENLSKAYQLGDIGTGTINRDIERWYARIRGKEDPFLRIGETNDRSKKGTSDIVWSLKDLNFEIEQGDAVGIIGRNGAGKSTLLKILSKVTAPTSGRISGKGRIASLLEVGTGFHPELSGRENIFLNGAILGMRKHEIKRKFDEIVDFAGIERYIDTPVKRYSSGMYVRLAFAVAAHLDSEILIIDEVLAVGDAEFQKKCLGKMGEVSKGEGRTVIFVSHNMLAVRELCKKGILLSNGGLQIEGNVEKVLSDYFHISEKEIISYDSSEVTLTDFQLCNMDNVSITSINNGEKFTFKICVTIKVNNPNIGFCIAMYDSINELVVSINTYHIAKQLRELKPGSYELTFPIPEYIFNTGQYYINLHLNSEHGEVYKIIENCGSLLITDDGVRSNGLFRGEWPGQISLVPSITVRSI